MVETGVGQVRRAALTPRPNTLARTRRVQPLVRELVSVGLRSAMRFAQLSTDPCEGPRTLGPGQSGSLSGTEAGAQPESVVGRGHRWSPTGLGPKLATPP